jgi:hypothetical protein
MSSKSKNPLYIDWAESEARSVVISDLQDGILSLDFRVTPVQEAWEYYRKLPEFSIVCYAQFKDKLSGHRRAVIKAGNRRQMEEAAMQHDRQLSPMKKQSTQGVLRYDLSATKPLLREDVKAGRHFKMTTAALRASRPEYMQEYSMRKFGEHARQEVKYQKFVNYLNEKREKEKQEKREVLERAKDERPNIKAKQEQLKAEQEAEINGKRRRTS